MKNKKWRRILIIIGLTAVILAAGLPAVGQICTAVESNRTEQIKRAVIQTAVQCYCVEGVYPQTLDYLEQHYGLLINHSRYIVSYTAISSNEIPAVKVIVRGQ